MAERYDAAWVAGMLSPARAALAPPDMLLTGAGVRANVTVVDLGCGPGFFTLPAARLVGPAGHVYAVDVEPRMLALVAERAAAEGLGTVTAIAARGTAVPLPAACADVVVCALVLHDLAEAERGEMAREIARLCRPDAQALIVEWQPRQDDTRWNRLAPAQIALLLEEVGLSVEKTAPLGEANHGTSDDEGMYAVVAHLHR